MRLLRLLPVALTLILCSTTNGFSQTSPLPVVPTDPCKGEIRISLKKAVALNDSLYKLNRAIDSLAQATVDALAARAADSTAFRKQRLEAAAWRRSFDAQAQLRRQALAERDQARHANLPWKIGGTAGVILGILSLFF